MLDTITFTGMDGNPVQLDRKSVHALTERGAGKVLEPGDAGFDTATLVWNAMVAAKPACVLQPASVETVVAAVQFARRHGVLMTIKGGGHNIAGTSLADGALTLDMSLMRQIEVDPVARTARVGPGCRLRDVDMATQPHGLAAVLGFVSETGAAGLTLGGGFGYLTRQHGWTVDNLDEVEIVTADGTVRRANPMRNTDLFWALRGGGGNLGVATEFIFRLHRAGPEITGGLIAWDAERAADVLELYRSVTAAAPREFTAAVTMRLAPAAPFLPESWHGKPIVAMVVCHAGDPARAESDLAPVRTFGRPIVDLIVRKPYVQQQAMLDATQPSGLHYYWKSEFVPGLPQGLLDAFRARGASVTSPRSQIILFHIGGALSERPLADGAVGNRDASYVCGIAGAWLPDDEAAARHVQWVRSSWDAIRPFSTGGNYVNFQTADEDATRTRQAYGSNFARLAEIKARYDPENLFRVNRNVAPGR